MVLTCVGGGDRSPLRPQGNDLDRILRHRRAQTAGTAPGSSALPEKRHVVVFRPVGRRPRGVVLVKHHDVARGDRRRASRGVNAAAEVIVFDAPALELLCW